MPDVEPEDVEEDEDAIIERRRQLRQAIVEKYQSSQPQTTSSSRASSPARSEDNGEGAGSDVDDAAAVDKAVKDLEESIRREEENRKTREQLATMDSPGIAKGIATTAVEGAGEEEKQRPSSLAAVKAALRNGDMFSEEDMFGEKHMVREGERRDGEREREGMVREGERREREGW